MKGLIKGMVAAIVLLTLSSANLNVMHKYYTSITEVEYVQNKESLQIITRIFLDDLEKAITEQTGKKIVFQADEEREENLKLLKDYLEKNLIILIDDKQVDFEFIGKRHDNNQIFAYLEIDNIKTIHQLELKNTVLTNTFKEQQNIIHIKVNGSNSSSVLTADNNTVKINYSHNK